jgi:hypothetical protein
LARTSSLKPSEPSPQPEDDFDFEGEFRGFIRRKNSGSGLSNGRRARVKIGGN